MGFLTLLPMPSLYSVPRVKACQSCWTAKAKCEPDTDYTKCKRCNRHKLDCVPRELVPRKRRKQTSNVKENERYEERLDTESPGKSDASTESRPVYSQLELDFGIHFYRSLLSQYFPFVILSNSSQDRRKFAEEKPFLSLVIAMLGCTHDRPRQTALAIECRKYLSVHILQNGEKSLDLLQGLLLKIHWYHWQFELPNQRSVFMHLAMAMVVDLELNKSPLARSRLRFVVAPGGTLSFEPRVGSTDHNFDEKRAFLGCLYLSSVISKCAAHMDGIRFSEHAERCCEYLETSQVSSDHDAVRMLRLQQIVERFECARTLFSQGHKTKDMVWVVHHDGPGQAIQIDAMSFVGHWEAELNKYWSSIPEIERTDLLRVQFDYARICLYEISLEESLFSQASDRVEILRNCMAAVKTLHAVFLPVTQQPAMLLNVPSHLFAQSSHAMFAAIQLCSVRCEHWSYKIVERELDLVRVLDASMVAVDSMLSSYPPIQVPTFFQRIAPMGRDIKKWYAAKRLTWDDGDIATTEATVESRKEHEMDLDFLGQFLDLDDNLWLQNLLSPDESQVPTLAL